MQLIFKAYKFLVVKYAHMCDFVRQKRNNGALRSLFSLPPSFCVHGNQ